MRIGSLFSGYGGLDLGVMEALGGTVAWHAELEDAPSRILAHHWPDVPNLGDVTAVDWSAVEPVDVICGGSPCQDVSMAGARKGMRAGTRSGLWASMCDAIDIIRPSLVIWENVRGALSAGADSGMEPCDLGMGCEGPVSLRALGRVLGDLAELGYDAGWEVVRASDIGAPHRRERVFVVAEPTDQRHERRGLARHGWTRPANGGDDALAPLSTPTCPDCRHVATAHRYYSRCQGTMQQPRCECDRTPATFQSAARLLPTPDANMGNGGRQRSSAALARGDHQVNLNDLPRLDFSRYGLAVARWETIIGRPAPAPTEIKPPPAPHLNRHGNQRANPTHRLSPRFVEWMMGLPEGHVVDVPGITRNQALKALGNGVVPQQAAHAITRILNMEAAA